MRYHTSTLIKKFTTSLVPTTKWIIEESVREDIMSEQTPLKKL